MSAWVMVQDRSWGLAASAMFAVSIMGCATTGAQRVSQAQAELDAKVECCSTWAQAKKAPLPLQPTRLKLDAESQVFRIDGEKSYVTVFELPAFSKAYSVMLTSIGQGGSLDTSVLAPRVLMLNEGFQVTRSFAVADLRSRGSNLERTVFVNPSNAGERYLVIHGTGLKSSYVRDVQIQTTQAMSNGMGGTFMWASGADAKGTVRSSPVGEIDISVDGLTPPQASR